MWAPKDRVLSIRTPRNLGVGLKGIALFSMWSGGFQFASVDPAEKYAASHLGVQRQFVFFALFNNVID